MAVHIQSSLLTNAVWREERECKHHKFEAQVSHYSFFFSNGGQAVIHVIDMLE